MKLRYSYVAILILLMAVQISSADTIKEVGAYSITVEADGILINKCQQHYFGDPIDPDKRKKLISIIFAGPRIRISNHTGQPDMICIVTNKAGQPLTSAKLKSGTLIEAKLAINDYLIATIKDAKTGIVIKSYYLKRVKLIPVTHLQQISSVNPNHPYTINFERDKDVPDSSLRYRLIREGDTALWQPTGHRLIIKNLSGNTLYRLEVAYRFQQKNTQAYSIITAAYWYQTAWFYGSITLLIITSIALLIKYRYEKKLLFTKQQQQMATERLKALQGQLNPHFIFNALNSIQAMINTGRIEDANMYLVEFSELLRNALTSSEGAYHSLHVEIAILETYLKLEQLRFGFHYSINISLGVDTRCIELPVLLLQPLVENAVKHGMAKIKEMGQIMITVDQSDKDLFITIKDNGHGYQPTAQSTGLGLKLTTERIKALNTLLNTQAVKYETRFSDGTIIELIFTDWL